MNVWTTDMVRVSKNMWKDIVCDLNGCVDRV
jgi:hypothetical protein